MKKKNLLKGIIAFSLLSLYALEGKSQLTYYGTNAGTSGNQSSYFGYYAGNYGGSTRSTYIGCEAGRVASGNNNAFLGYCAGRSNSSGTGNTYLGTVAGYNNATGYNNVFIGLDAGAYTTGGDYNVFLGAQTGGSVNNGDRNVFIGYRSGYTNIGDDNIFIGYNAGYSETGDDKLYIDNTNTSSPLIYGDFDSDELTINGEFSVNANDGTTADGAEIIVKSSTDYDGGKIFLLPGNGSNSTGNVRISSSTTSGTGITLTRTGSITCSGSIVSNSSVQGTKFFDDNNTSYYLWPSTTIVPSLTLAGKAGIGTTSPSEMLHVVGNGIVTGTLAISGTSVPTGYKMSVDGDVIAERYVAMDSGDWPDYVFDKTYKKMNLFEIEKFINTNSHLPEIPSASQVAEEGVDLAEMDKLLLKKIEEITLHLIDLKKENEELKNQISTLSK